jgi:hypothetical protein
MSGSFIQALERKPWEKHVQTNAKSTFLAQNALPSPTLDPHDDGSGLPTAASGGNISPERPVIRWMSARKSRVDENATDGPGRRPIPTLQDGIAKDFGIVGAKNP